MIYIIIFLMVYLIFIYSSCVVASHADEVVKKTEDKK